METTELFSKFKSNQEEGKQLREELEKHQEEVLQRLYEALKDAYAVGIRFCDADHAFFNKQLYPLNPCFSDNPGTLEFTHARDSAMLWVQGFWDNVESD